MASSRWDLRYVAVRADAPSTVHRSANVAQQKIKIYVPRRRLTLTLTAYELSAMLCRAPSETARARASSDLSGRCS